MLAHARDDGFSIQGFRQQRVDERTIGLGQAVIRRAKLTPI
jgi:hypothetical protein